MGSRAARVAAWSGDEDMTPYEKANAWFKVTASVEGYDGHDSKLHNHLTLISAVHNPTPSHPHQASTTFSMTVPTELCNMSGSLHGGAVALIFDICTSVTINLCKKDGFWDAGHVSRTLNCTYLRPAQAGMKVFVESQVVHLGKRMGMLTGVIRGAEDGKVYYTCEHGKACLEGTSNL